MSHPSKLTISTNMARIVARLLGKSRRLSPQLSRSLKLGLVEDSGCVVLKTGLKGAGRYAPRPYHDRTAYEWFANHIHIDPKNPRDRTPLSQGINYAERLVEILKNSAHRGPFRVILSFHMGDRISTVGFHRVRRGEDLLVNDLDSYKDSAILVIDC